MASQKARATGIRKEGTKLLALTQIDTRKPWQKTKKQKKLVVSPHFWWPVACFDKYYERFTGFNWIISYINQVLLCDGGNDDNAMLLVVTSSSKLEINHHQSDVIYANIST